MSGILKALNSDRGILGDVRYSKISNGTALHGKTGKQQQRTVQYGDALWKPYAFKRGNEKKPVQGIVMTKLINVDVLDDLAYSSIKVLGHVESSVFFRGVIRSEKSLRVVNSGKP